MTIPADDPTRQSHIKPLMDLLRHMDDDIASLYAERGVTVRTRFSIVLIRLHHLGPLTVRELAREIDVTHSAMSQTVAALRRQGMVATAPGSDARTRTVSLTDRGRETVPFLEAEWRATEASMADLEAEVPYPLGRVVSDIAEALRRKSFRDRIVGHLESP
ncbi:MarR family winged helix-turn-helix transcriptional regulator [Pseudonocardia endophytica]|uniref:MarR family protein n=1 Tax=Pseudonocardia endophytica TaxID=401976 RepID=A0A4R1HQE8_PSEEN|nr:MarR family protein [Pseudonocardia endophytica]